jgi:hypothetical protein
MPMMIPGPSQVRTLVPIPNSTAGINRFIVFSPPDWALQKRRERAAFALCLQTFELRKSL